MSTAITATEIGHLVPGTLHTVDAVKSIHLILDVFPNAQRQQVIATVENWWDRYHVSLEEIEAERETAVEKLNRITEELGYVVR